MAIKNTFDYRKYKIDFISSFKIIKNSSILPLKWKNYSKRFEYAKDIKFNDILNCLEIIINEITN